MSRTNILTQVAFVNKGDYSPDAVYDRLDFVTTTDSSYLSLQDNNIGHAVDDLNWWQPLALGTQATQAAEKADEATEKADTAAAKADGAAEAILQVPVVRTDMAQNLTPAEQQTSRTNISGVGYLRLSATLGAASDAYPLTLTSPLEELTAAYALYQANPGHYRWTLVISGDSFVEESELEPVQVVKGLDLHFQVKTTGLHYTLALGVIDGTVTGASVDLWERDRQTGVDTSKGYLNSGNIDIDKYNSDRSLETYFTTGDDVNTRQDMYGVNPVSLIISTGNMYVNMWGGWSIPYPIQPQMRYHVAVIFVKNTREASLYVNGMFVSSAVRTDVEPVYSSTLTIGTNASGASPFQGVVHMLRLFNLTFSAREIALFYNNGDPMVRVLPEWCKRAGGIIEQASPESWIYQGGASYNPTTGEFHITSATGEIAGVIPLTSARRMFDRFDIIYCLRFKAKGYGAMTVVDSGAALRPITSKIRITPPSTTEYTEYSLLIAFSNSDRISLKRSSAGEWYIRDVEISTVGCIAEYLPQNIRIVPVRDFPSAVFPVAGFTPSSMVFTPNSSALTAYRFNVPQANGFSGSFMRFESVSSESNAQVSLYCDYWHRYLLKKVPLEITLEYRCNYDIYFSQGGANPGDPMARVALPANEGSPITTVVTYRLGNSAYLFDTKKADSWLEMRVLSIEIAAGTLGWLDSSKQLPLLDGQYLPPLLEPIVREGTTPILIAGKNSYTWTGISDPTYGAAFNISRPWESGYSYKVRVTLSNYEAGEPFIHAGPDAEAFVPKENGTYDLVLKPLRIDYLIGVYGGPANTDRRLTLTVDSIELTVERSYDLVATGTPKVVYSFSQLPRIVKNQETATPQMAQMYSLARMSVNTMALTDEQALEVKNLYPEWAEYIGQTLDPGMKVLYEGRLFRVLQQVVVQQQQNPSLETAAIYEEINETAAGTLDDPIPYNGGMELVEGLYYTQGEALYHCIRSSEQAVYHDLKDLAGLYVETTINNE